MDDKPLNEFELDQLAKYNSEVVRGLVHTEEWKQRMSKLQERFNKYKLKEFYGR